MHLQNKDWVWWNRGSQLDLMANIDSMQKYLGLTPCCHFLSTTRKPPHNPKIIRTAIPMKPSYISHFVHLHLWVQHYLMLVQPQWKEIEEDNHDEDDDDASDIDQSNGKLYGDIKVIMMQWVLTLISAQSVKRSFTTHFIFVTKINSIRIRKNP